MIERVDGELEALLMLAHQHHWCTLQFSGFLNIPVLLFVISCPEGKKSKSKSKSESESESE